MVVGGTAVGKGGAVAHARLVKRIRRGHWAPWADLCRTTHSLQDRPRGVKRKSEKNPRPQGDVPHSLNLGGREPPCGQRNNPARGWHGEALTHSPAWHHSGTSPSSSDTAPPPQLL